MATRRRAGKTETVEEGKPDRHLTEQAERESLKEIHATVDVGSPHKASNVVPEQGDNPAARAHEVGLTTEDHKAAVRAERESLREVEDAGLGSSPHQAVDPHPEQGDNPAARAHEVGLRPDQNPPAKRER